MGLSTNRKKKLFETYGNWALITGATSGIGYQIALELASAGFNLLIVSRNEDVLNRMAAMFRGKHRIEVETVCADLSTTEGVMDLISIAEGFDISLLVTSAGFGSTGKFVDASLENELNMLWLNCESVLLLAYEFANRFKAKKRGGIIFLSSLVAFHGSPNVAHYAATKAYVQVLGEGLAEELKPFNVDVLVSAPGPVYTNFGARANMNVSKGPQPSVVAQSILKAIGKTSTNYPGGLAKFLKFSLCMLPRFGKIKVMKKVMGGLTVKT